MMVLDAVHAPRSGGALVGTIKAGLAAVGDPAKAAGMQAYMKSAMPFRGVSSPDRKRLLRGLFQMYPPPDRPTWEATVRLLWDLASYREERYAATALTGHRVARPWQDLAAMPLYEHMIVTGAWWDHVDELASQRVGPILRSHPVQMSALLREWAVSSDRWLRRTAILAQLGSKESTDVGLLSDVLTANLRDQDPITNDFFIRKGVGWALRQHARTDPAWVRAFVTTHRDQLSPLSIREATKHL
jgi:3-methyladenine DNA glycosylase AlkD